MITVDYREAALIDIIEGCQKENLIHGDIVISSLPEKTPDDLEYVTVTKDEDTVSEVCYIIERKTLSDLSASIKDSRFREQKSRLVSVYPNDKVVYIIEGWKTNKHSLPEKTLMSAITNLVFRHGFKVLFTRNIQDTASVIKDIHTKLLKGDLDQDMSEYGQDNLGFVPIKKSEISENNALACQLSTIPGVSPSIARVIQNKYINMSTLVKSIEGEAEPRKVLANLLVTPKRKLGPKLSEKIYIALFE